MGAMTYDNGDTVSDNQARNQGQHIFHSFNGKWTVLTASAEISLALRSPERGAAVSRVSSSSDVFDESPFRDDSTAHSVFVLFAYFLPFPRHLPTTPSAPTYIVVGAAVAVRGSKTPAQHSRHIAP